MENFINFLKSTKTALENNDFNEIHIVIGNESCDLDSCVSSLILAYHLHNNKITGISSETLVVPVQNVIFEEFLYRSETCMVLKEAGISLNLLTYRNHIDIQKLIREKRVTTTLVDHHMLNEKDKSLESTVIQIVDHRPIDEANKWNRNEVDMTIEQVGSCSTLIANKVFVTSPQTLPKELAYMIYETIIYDTIALLPEKGKAKELDLQIAADIQKKFHFNEDRKALFDKLWKAHNDVSHLTPRQILSKDLKIVNNIPVPGLPMLVIDFLQMENTYQCIKDFALEQNTHFVLLIGMDSTGEVKRDVGMFFNEEAIPLKNSLLKMFYNSQELKGYDFGFHEVPSQYKDILCLRQQNVKLSRKQIIPILKHCLLDKLY